jgi:hypothetical protein
MKTIIGLLKQIGQNLIINSQNTVRVIITIFIFLNLYIPIECVVMFPEFPGKIVRL